RRPLVGVRKYDGAELRPVDLAVRAEQLAAPAADDFLPHRRLSQCRVAERIAGDQTPPAAGQRGGDFALAAAHAAPQAQHRTGRERTLHPTSSTSSQFGPAATSTASGTFRSMAVVISCRTISARRFISSGGASKTSSSCTVNNIRDSN